ncbi:FtsW/RodA/SpoVE family cell cycle protein [Massilia violaceinigra]|uniref:Probable peptidoglycan glycosyltransferase FtsW n=1 Tax=Massilia violaceinigra TaxID=2045208 RepID=A0ABY4A1T0_9BURK|nr:FtsW/RodA/SpoVE family cell cycle protein [Massilia violaceinigra]UOD28705.1 FtsW/RodA/SpoVE family cell cycle protein [Massilia violaceinigra]
MKRFSDQSPGFILTAALLAILCLLQLVCLWRAPPAWSPERISVTLRPGESITLGDAELAAPQADNAHLALRRAADGIWWAGNASAAKQVLLQRDGVDRRMGSSVLRGGQSFRIGAARFDVGAANARQIAFAGPGAQWRYDGATLYRDDSAQPACPDAGVAARAIALWNRAMPQALTVARPLTFGGNLYCGNRLGIAYVEGASATIARTKDGLLLSGAAGRAPLMMSSSAGQVDLARSAEALAGVQTLVAGRTRLGVRIDDGVLHLLPLRHVALYAEADALLPAQVAWQWKKRGIWTLPAGRPWSVALGLCALLAVAAGANWQRGAWPFTRDTSRPVRMAAGASALLVIAGVAALLFQRSGSAPGVGWSMLLAWAALWGCLLVPARLSLATAAGVLLLAVGLLAQLELGFGGAESAALRHFQKSVALLAIGLGIGAHLRLRLHACAAAPALPQTTLEWVLALFALAALGALLMQVVFGDETGVFDLQPVEFAKLALTALTAHCLAIGLGWHAHMPEQSRPARRWLRLAAPVLLFAALLALALVQVDDYSPLILLLVWCMAMALAWALATRTHLATAALFGVACVAAGSVAWLRSAGVAEVAQWGFYADRFLVWLDPAQHPHTGQQLLLAARAIAEGAWWGADSRLGLGAMGQIGGSALHIPAVQDDFAPSFFLNRHGLLGALALWALQALFLVGLLQTAARCFGASEQTRDFRQGWLWRFRCFALCGGAAFVLGHFLLSWGTNLAIFPIMGQPMSFLSAGGSHLLFFICPLLAFSAISAQSFEENQPCRSTSNMKSWAR